MNHETVSTSFSSFFKDNNQREASTNNINGPEAIAVVGKHESQPRTTGSVSVAKGF